MFLHKTITFGMALGLLWIPRMAFADWDTVPPLRVEERLFMTPPLEPEDSEAEQEAEEFEKQSEEGRLVDRYLAVEGGYYANHFNFASTGQGEYQAFLFGETDRYGFAIRLDYLNQFGTEAFGFQLGGHYFVAPNIRAGLRIRFAPRETLIESHGYEPFLQFGLWNRQLVGTVRYQFRDFRQANLHDGELALRLRLGRYVTVGPLYHLNVVQPGGGGPDRTNHSARIRVAVHPIPMLTLFGRYAFTEQAFEAGAPTPLDAWQAQEFGGGLEAQLGVGVGFYFEYRLQDRDNGETAQFINLGTHFRF